MGTIAPRRLKSKKEEQEFGLARKEFVICPDCNSIFFDKAWHHKLEEDIKHLKEFKGLKFKTCPACRMKKDRTFEGELTIKLSKEGLGEKRKILNAVKNSDEQARSRDPMDRILWTEDEDSKIRVLTSENQLVTRIGKKLKSAFGGTLEIRHSHEEDVIRVRWER